MCDNLKIQSKVHPPLSKGAALEGNHAPCKILHIDAIHNTKTDTISKGQAMYHQPAKSNSMNFSRVFKNFEQQNNIRLLKQRQHI